MNAASRLTLSMALALAFAACTAYVAQAHRHDDAHAAAAQPQGADAVAHLAAARAAPAPATSPAGMMVLAASYRDAVAHASAAVVTVYRSSPHQGPSGAATLALAIASGVVLDRDGSIVTSKQLAGQPGNLRVGLADGTQRPARVLGVDAVSGIALIKAEGAALKPIELAAAERPAVGDVVLALGDALGFGPTATLGIVSAIRVARLEGGPAAEFIQADAAIHSGNFGGALVDAAGRLVGINVGTVGSGAGKDFALAVPADRVALFAARVRGGPVAGPARPPAAPQAALTQIAFHGR